MSDGGYDAFDDPYAYAGTTVLKNRLDIRDQQRLQAFELEMSTLRSTEPLPVGRLSATHYRAIHHHLFQDVYTWAGRYRTVRTAKGGNWFCYPEHIPQEMARVFAELRRHSFLARRRFEEFAEGAAHFLAELNAIHPFREGNGRSQLSFVHQLAVKAGHPINLNLLRPDAFLEAMIASFRGRTAPLRQKIVLMRAV